MKIDLPLSSPKGRLLRVGFMVGCSVVFLETVLFGTGISPVLVVGMLLISSFVLGVLWGPLAWTASFSAWVVFPFAQLAKLQLGLSEAPAPDPYLAILVLAGLSLLSTAAGTAIGNLFHKSLIQS